MSGTCQGHPGVSGAQGCQGPASCVPISPEWVDSESWDLEAIEWVYPRIQGDMSQKLLSMSLQAVVPKSQVVECYPSVIEQHQYYKGGDHQDSNNPTASGGWPKHEHGSKAISLQMPFQKFTAWQMTFLIFLLHFFSFFFFKLFTCYLFLAVLWVFIALFGLSLVGVRGGYSSLQCTGFSLWWLLLLQSTGSKACGLQQLWPMG